MTELLDRSPLSTLIEGSLDALDITRSQYELAVTRYEHLGAWLWEHGVGEPRIYPQGSFRLGTVVRPGPDGEFDLDMVFVRDLKRTSVSQIELKKQAGDLLAKYVKECGDEVGAPELVEKGRCWCLVWSDDALHMDILPVIPNEEATAAPFEGELVLLTDRDLHHWQHSNPIGYANWFYGRMKDIVEERRTALAKSLELSVEDVPTWLVRTPLQRSVQVLKRHRDLYFTDHHDDQPTSILITTLVGMAYQGHDSVEGTVADVVRRLDDFVERRDNGLWVPNPAQPQENFADKWSSCPERRQFFLDWLGTLVADVSEWTALIGLDAVTASLQKSFGTEPVQRAAARLGKEVTSKVAVGAAAVASNGRLTSAAAGNTPIPKHTFHAR